MCFGSKQPEAPINKPSYAVEDSWKHAEVSVDEDKKNTTGTSVPASSKKDETSAFQSDLLKM